MPGTPCKNQKNCVQLVQVGPGGLKSEQIFAPRVGALGLLKGGCTDFGRLICFKGYLEWLRALSQIWINLLIRKFGFLFYLC